ncbi:glycerate kinase type-2 family protein [Leeia oryzae]|uniref:glycerate kinase type-2 family protein n=1 Tax=Leeia oryzae TaxID=356662 RepID=UPI00036B7539|nr:glycerate kinase [Leeia oryzae]
MDDAQLLRLLFDAAIAEAQPSVRLKHMLPDPPKGRTVVIGAGKASAEMAWQLEQCWPGPLTGVVVTRYGQLTPCRQIRLLEASHPFPDQNSLEAAQEIKAQLVGLTEDDLVIALISGGGSALLVDPVEGVTLAEKQAVTKAMFAAGATIRELNTVRQQLSRIKGGKLAQMAKPARVVTYIISDIPGDTPSFVASGPTVAPTPAEDAWTIIQRLGLSFSPAVMRALQAPASLAADSYDHCEVRMLATPMQSLQAAAAKARQSGLEVMILSDQLEGEAKEIALAHAGMVRSIMTYDTPIKRPALLLSGGETTVTFANGPSGKGGRNTEFLLALGYALRDLDNVTAIACDTDGIDGSENNAGAIWRPDSAARVRLQKLDPLASLSAHDSYTFFEQLGDLIVTGPTQTNVNDFRAILVR